MCRLIERCRSKKCCTLWPHKFLRQVVWTAVVPAVGWHSFFQNAGSKWSTTSQTGGKIPSRTFCKQNLNWMTNCWRGFLLFVCLSGWLTHSNIFPMEFICLPWRFSPLLFHLSSYPFLPLVVASVHSCCKKSCMCSLVCVDVDFVVVAFYCADCLSGGGFVCHNHHVCT